MKVIIDNGHGGLINGKYVTAGKRSPIEFGEPQILEGVRVRKIANLVSIMLNANKIDNVLLVPEQEDISLGERVRRANNIYSKDKNSFLVSIHLNAGGGTGFEAFTSVGETKSDKIASAFYHKFLEMFPDKRMRKDITDGDDDKEAHFYILKNTNCPAVLIECFFMDNKDDFELLNRPDTNDKIAGAIFNSIMKCKELYYS